MKTFTQLRKLVASLTSVSKATDDAKVEAEKLATAVTETLTEDDFLNEAAAEIGRQTGMCPDEARFILDSVANMGGDLQLKGGQVIVDLPTAKVEEVNEFQKQLAIRQHKTAPASELSNFDVTELQEAARQASAMLGITEKQAMLKLMDIGRQFKHIDRTVKAPRARVHETKACLCCGKEKQHSNAFCSGECARQYKKEAVVKDRTGRTIRPGMTVEIMEGGDMGKLLKVEAVLFDNPTLNEPGYWIDCIEDGMTSGMMSYMVEIHDGDE